MSAARVLSLVTLLCLSALATAQTITVGSKNFAENYVLAEIVAQLLESRGYDVERRLGLNGTRIIFEALSNRAIDVYPEYSGTITEVIVRRPELDDIDDIRAALQERGFDILEPLGFNNSYALAVTNAFAAKHELRTISDLSALRDLRVSVPHEFLNRSDGWPGLKAAYGLPYTAGGIEHALAYDAMAQGEIDVTAVYTTDGEIIRTGLTVLEDDRGYFPRYLATLFLHSEVSEAVRAVLAELDGRVDDGEMRTLNLAALDPDTSFAEVATSFLIAEGLAESSAPRQSFVPQLIRNVQRHLKLTGIALSLAIVFGVGIAPVAGNKRPRLRVNLNTDSGRRKILQDTGKRLLIGFEPKTILIDPEFLNLGPREKSAQDRCNQ